MKKIEERTVTDSIIDGLENLFHAAVPVILALATALMALRNVEGWGWFLFATLLSLAFEVVE